MRTHSLSLAAVLGLCATAATAQDLTAADRAMPRYAHVFVIVEENKDYEQILDPAVAPNIAGLAAQYGDATRFFGEVHPSEANYVALLGGDTFGIHDDDAFYCHAGLDRSVLRRAGAPGYADHTVRAPHLGDQLEAAGLSWKGYYEDLPEPGSLAVTASDPASTTARARRALYASKHSGFMNFASVQADPRRAEHIVGFDQLDADLAADRLPNFALIVPNQCNEMHGLHGAELPADCDGADHGRPDRAAATRGRRRTGRSASRPPRPGARRTTSPSSSPSTRAPARRREGCCGGDARRRRPTSAAATSRPSSSPTTARAGVKDETPYNHYSLLRTIEDAFGIGEHLGPRRATDEGVRADGEAVRGRPLRKIGTGTTFDLGLVDGRCGQESRTCPYFRVPIFGSRLRRKPRTPARRRAPRRRQAGRARSMSNGRPMRLPAMSSSTGIGDAARSGRRPRRVGREHEPASRCARSATLPGTVGVAPRTVKARSASAASSGCGKSTTRGSPAVAGGGQPPGGGIERSRERRADLIVFANGSTSSPPAASRQEASISSVQRSPSAERRAFVDVIDQAALDPRRVEQHGQAPALRVPQLLLDLDEHAAHRRPSASSMRMCRQASPIRIGAEKVT